MRRAAVPFPRRLRGPRLAGHRVHVPAGAVQDHQRGIVMGTNSFGKGTVQEVETFYDNSSLRLTIGKWFTPNDRDIDKKGITPDIIVEITEEDMKNQFDRQKEEAINYLNNL